MWIVSRKISETFSGFEPELPDRQSCHRSIELLRILKWCGLNVKTYNLGESSSRAFLNNDEAVLDKSFADVGLRCGIIQSCVWHAVAPVICKSQNMLSKSSQRDLHEFNIQLQRLVENVLGEGFVSFNLIFFIRWQDGPSKHILSGVRAIFCEGGWKSSKASCWNNLEKINLVIVWFIKLKGM